MGPLDTGPELPSARDELLNRVVKRGRTLRRRGRATQLGSSLVALAVLGAMVTSGLSKSREPDDAMPVVPVPTVTVTMTATATPSPVKQAPVRASSPSFRCVRTFDPACGPVRWEPALPPNKPIQIRWGDEKDPQGFRVQAGATWERWLEIHDEVAHLRWIDFGDGTRTTYPVGRLTCREPHGLWTSPYTDDPRYAGWADDGAFWAMNFGPSGISHVWARPGRYELTVHATGGLRENLGACLHDYERDVATRTVIIEVYGDQTSPTPSPSPTLGLPRSE